MKQVNALEFYDLARYMGAVCQEVGLTLHRSEKGYSYLQDKRVYLAPEPSPIDNEKAVRNLRRLLHEIAHVTDTDVPFLKAHPLPEGSFLESLTEMLEDHRIEHVQSQRYQGDADILDAGSSLDMGRALKSAEKMQSTPLPDPKEQDKIDKLTALLKAERDLRSEFQPSMLENDLTLTAAQKVHYDRIMAHADEIREVRAMEGREGTAKVYDLAKRIFEDTGGDAEEEEKKGKAQKGDGAAKAGGGKEKGSKGEGESKAGKEAREQLQFSPNGKHEEGVNEENYSRLGGGIGRKGIGQAVPALPEEFYVRNFHNPAKGNSLKHASTCRDDADTEYSLSHSINGIAKVREAASTTEQLAQKMRRIVQIRTRSRTQYGLKSGKLHGASLHRIAANVPGYSERVFKQKTVTLDLDAAVAVCVDMSGSMSGPKVDHACAAAEMLSETVGNALGIPLMIYGFSETRNVMGNPGPSPSIFVMRDFNEHQLSTDTLRKRAAIAIAHTMGNNPDGDAVIWGYHQLRQAKGKRKILFVLSDGCPATGRVGNQAEYLSHVTALIERSPIKLFGLGLMDHNVTSYYKRHAVVSSASQIESKIIELVDQFILEGK